MKFRFITLYPHFLYFLLHFLEMHEVDYTNSTAIIRQHPKMTAINSCIEVDLSGQVCSDSIGTRMYSGQY